jgi:hypothetical protein
MHRNMNKVLKTTSLALSLAVSGITTASAGDAIVYDAYNYLPVSSEGSRFTSSPYGEVAAILSVASQVRTNGQMQRISSRGLHIPNKAGNRIIARYDYTFPASCGGASFSYYEGSDFRALGLHRDGKVVFDVLQGGGPYSAPRLWGPYDQVVNDPVPMRVVMSKGGESGFGLMKASFVAGKVADMPEHKQQGYGASYSSSVFSAKSCGGSGEAGNILVRK